MNKRVITILFFLSLGINIAIVLFFSRRIYFRYKNAKPANITIEKKETTDNFEGLKYTSAFLLNIKGKYHNEKNYNRLPLKFEQIVRPKLWEQSKNSSGISVRFKSNSTTIAAKWLLKNNSYFANMNKIGSGGLDLYCLVDDKWQYLNSAIPTGFVNQSVIMTDMDTTYKEYLLNLPLYDGVEYVEIGTNENSSILPSVINTNATTKPIVFYGTSITQGGGASRPGMAYPSIVSRNLNIETINLGFNGNGKLEESIGKALCEIDASLFVIDCTPNSTPDTIKKNAIKLIQQIRKCKSQTPILLVESIIREYAYLKQTDENTKGGIQYILAQNRELKQSFNTAIQAGINDVYYLQSEDLIGSDHEATVDGTHLSDLGASRIAEKMENKIKEILKLK